jgi:hypothetical protein
LFHDKYDEGSGKVQCKRDILTTKALWRTEVLQCDIHSAKEAEEDVSVATVIPSTRTLERSI